MLDVSYQFLRNNTVDFPSLLSLYQNIACTCFVDNHSARLTTRAFETFLACLVFSRVSIRNNNHFTLSFMRRMPNKKFSKCLIHTLFFTRWSWKDWQYEQVEIIFHCINSTQRERRNFHFSTTRKHYHIYLAYWLPINSLILRINQQTTDLSFERCLSLNRQQTFANSLKECWEKMNELIPFNWPSTNVN